MRARLPPPAPISTRSTDGTDTGKPEPFLNRYMRATSKVVVSSGSKSLMRQDLAVVPPMSKHSRRRSPSLRANHEPASAPAAGPDSTRRIGTRAASAAETTPPFDSIISTEPPKPSAASHFCSSSR